jgi:hypothetical protein
VYEVIPHYQRRRLHAKLAQELERSLEEHHVATLTTIAYHWNQACMGHEVTEVECALKVGGGGVTGVCCFSGLNDTGFTAGHVSFWTA